MIESTELPPSTPEVVSAADRAMLEIRSAILTGRLVPGQELRLRPMAAQLGVSFIPVREALRSLEAQGLLHTTRGRSATVAPLDADDLRGIFRLRRRIEPDLVVRACALTSIGDLDAIEARFALAPDPCRHAQEGHGTHRDLLLDLLRPAASEWDVRTLQMLWRATERYVRAGVERPGLTLSDPVLHDLVAGYRARDSRAAGDAMRRHLDRDESIAQRALATGPSLHWSSPIG
jgi:DNA-binding GntR family transcriptional regulator